MIRRFINTFRLYHRHHGWRYALARAWHIEIQGSPF